MSSTVHQEGSSDSNDDESHSESSVFSSEEAEYYESGVASKSRLPEGEITSPDDEDLDDSEELDEEEAEDSEEDSESDEAKQVTWARQPKRWPRPATDEPSVVEIDSNDESEGPSEAADSSECSDDAAAVKPQQGVLSEEASDSSGVSSPLREQRSSGNASGISAGEAAPDAAESAVAASPPRDPPKQDESLGPGGEEPREAREEAAAQANELLDVEGIKPTTSCSTQTACPDGDLLDDDLQWGHSTLNDAAGRSDTTIEHSTEQHRKRVHRLSRLLWGTTGQNIIELLRSDEREKDKLRSSDTEEVRKYISPFSTERQQRKRKRIVQVPGFDEMDSYTSKRVKHIDPQSPHATHAGTVEEDQDLAQCLGGWSYLYRLKNQLAVIDRDLLERLVVEQCATDPRLIQKVTEKALQTTGRHASTSGFLLGSHRYSAAT